MRWLGIECKLASSLSPGLPTACLLATVPLSFYLQGVFFGQDDHRPSFHSLRVCICPLLLFLSFPEGGVTLVEHIQYPLESLARLVLLKTFLSGLFGDCPCELQEMGVLEGDFGEGGLEEASVFVLEHHLQQLLLGERGERGGEGEFEHVSVGGEAVDQAILEGTGGREVCLEVAEEREVVIPFGRGCFGLQCLTVLRGDGGHGGELLP